MRKLTLSLSLLAVVATAMGQGVDRTSAIVAFKKFNEAVQSQNMDVARKRLLEAKEYIDKSYAAANDDPKTLFYRGEIYSSLPLVYIDMANSTIDPADMCSAQVKYDGIDDATAREYGKTAIESYKMTITKLEGQKDRDDFKGQIARKANFGRVTAINCGNTSYNAKNYEKAAEQYSKSIALFDLVNMTDTIAYYFRGLSYMRLEKHAEAAADLKKCAELNFGNDNAQKADVYSLAYESLVNAGKNDEARALLTEGRKKYPKQQVLIISEVNYFLGKGDNMGAEKAINEALALDPKNEMLYFALGNTYDNLANPRDASGKDLDKPANFQELSKKAEDAYLKAIELRADYFDALYNVGVLKYNEGAEHMNRIKDIADNAQYDAEKKKADEKFAKALPYLEKAKTLNAKDCGNLRMLKIIYLRLGQNDKVLETQKEITALGC